MDQTTAGRALNHLSIFECRECGVDMFISPAMTAHHLLAGSCDVIDHDADRDHVAVADRGVNL